MMGGMVGIIRRAYGVLGLGGAAFGVAGWQDDAKTWAEWAEVNPELAGALMGGGGVMFATWIVWEAVMLWRRGKPLQSDQPMTQPAINQTFNFDAGADVGDLARRLRDEMDGETVRGLRETIRRLPQEPLGDGHTYAHLPDGTNIVSMADGSYRLALPVRIRGSLGITGVGGSTLKPPHQDDAYALWKVSPGAGRNAAKAIAKATTLEEAREVWGAFYGAPRRTDTNWAFWAFIARLEEAGEGQEVYSLSFDLHGGEEDLDPTEEIQTTIDRWRNEDDG